MREFFLRVKKKKESEQNEDWLATIGLLLLEETSHVYFGLVLLLHLPLATHTFLFPFLSHLKIFLSPVEISTRENSVVGPGKLIYNILQSPIY